MNIQNLIYGLIIGLGFIIPGVSGGVIATILGIYETIIDKILNFFRDVKENAKYLLPLIMGIILSVFLFSKVILYLLEEKLFFISYVFIGLILGCVPCLVKEIKNKTKQNIAISPFLISFSLGIMLFIWEKKIPETSATPSFLTMALAGVIYAVGKIVPGISGAALLMFIGVYKYLLNIIANPFGINLKVLISLIPFIISFLLSAIIILKLVSYLLKKHFRISYSAIIGFVISSILFIYPGHFNLLSIIITTLSFTISYYLSK